MLNEERREVREKVSMGGGCRREAESMILFSFICDLKLDDVEGIEIVMLRLRLQWRLVTMGFVLLLCAIAGL